MDDPAAADGILFYLLVIPLIALLWGMTIGLGLFAWAEYILPFWRSRR